MKVRKFDDYRLNESYFDATLNSEDVEDLFLGICDTVGVGINSKGVKASHQFVDKNGRAYGNLNALYNARGVDEYKNYYQFFITVPKKIGVDASQVAGIKSVANDQMDNMMGHFADNIQQMLGGAANWADINDEGEGEWDDEFADEQQEADNDEIANTQVNTGGFYFNDASKFKEIADEIASIQRKLKAKDIEMYFTGFFIGGTINFFMVDNKFTKMDKSKKDLNVDLKEIITTINYRIPSDYNKFRMVDTGGYIYVLCIDQTVSMTIVDRYLIYLKGMFKKKYSTYTYEEVTDYTIRYETKGNYITNKTRGLDDSQADGYRRMGYMPIVKIQIVNKSDKKI
jgi:hypothetical protein